MPETQTDEVDPRGRIATRGMYVGIWKYQREVAALYTSKQVQVFVAGLIVGNFGFSCTKQQIDPDGEIYPIVWLASENFFNVIFALELIMNMYGFWCMPFFRSAWNIFDLTVVSIGLLDIIQAPLPGPMKLVRMLRAFRVFRLFGRVESLKKILMMIHRALPGVASAFLLNLIVLCIYAVLAVDFFKDIHEECTALEAVGRLPPGAKTARGKCFGQDYYGSFLRSLYTLFQILTGESWSEAAVRPVLHFFEQRSVAETAGVAIFFISFIMINAVVLLNVVVAVLIEGMSGPDEEDTEEVELTDDDTDGHVHDYSDGSFNHCHWKTCEEPDEVDNSGNFPRHDTPDSGGPVSSHSKVSTTLGKVGKRARKIEEKWMELLTVNESISVDVMHLQNEVDGVKNTLRSVSSEFKDSCSVILAELQERRMSMAMRAKQQGRPSPLFREDSTIVGI